MAINLNKTFDGARISGLAGFVGFRYRKLLAASALLVLVLIGFITSVAAQSDVRSTLHNLSKYKTISPLVVNPNTVKATDETQVCVFCHTPHGANTSAITPLWNRSGSTAQTYTRYDSSSLDTNSINDGFSAQPGGSSLLCLSCHDGMIALGNVNVLNGAAANAPAAAASGLTGTMPTGLGSNTGFTRHLGTDLSNDHPISITYSDAMAVQDGEFARLTLAASAPAQRDVETMGTLIGIRTSGYKPKLPLEPTSGLGAGQVQCATCHDPHITKEKFLRLNRFQGPAEPTNTFSQTDDQICLACHRKLGSAWSNSAHANSTNAAYVYKDDASLTRGFPRPTDAGAPALKKVWEVACLNCHDTHTVSGSRRLLREGTGTAASLTSAAYQAGSTLRPLENASAIENTCYQCHTTTTKSIVTTAAMTASTGVPDIWSEFERTIRMPIKTADQDGARDKEKHDIRNADFIECRKNLGNTSAVEEPAGSHLTALQKTACNALTASEDNRHVECTDCHNPHRVIKNSLFTGTGSATQRTHTAGGANGNIASGVLRGAWGVEPLFGAMENSWPQAATATFAIKKGLPDASFTDSGQTYLTREYQLCFKCHSNYAANTFPLLGNTLNGTPSTTNGMSRYTNIAAEFGSVKATATATGSGDQGEYGESSVATEDPADLEPAGSYPADTDPGTSMTDIAGTQNHRSWHPVMWPTGRTLDERRISNATYNFRAPFAANVGTQTMHCSDCHGQSTSWTQNTGPNLAQVQGPHGSSNNFLLKGAWSTSTTISSPDLCGNCHNPTATKDTNTGSADNLASQPSGFNNHGTNSQGGHGNAHGGKMCMRCHIAVPHGWKNKAFLVNLNCVGTEGGQASGCVTVSGVAGLGNNAAKFTQAPYYNESFLRVAVWRASGNWSETSCGVAAGGLKGPGKDWMTDGNGC